MNTNNVVKAPLLLIKLLMNSIYLLQILLPGFVQVGTLLLTTRDVIEQGPLIMLVPTPVLLM